MCSPVMLAFGGMVSSNRPITLRKRITGRLVSHQSGKRLGTVFPVLATAVKLVPSNVGRLLDEPRVTDLIDSFGRTRGA